ncbi:hypothetical protein LguiB_019109 [Lonicera macranthoides]
MGKRRRPRKIGREEEEEDGESIYTPPPSIRNKLNQHSPPHPSPATPSPGSFFRRPKYTTRQSVIASRSRTQNVKAVPSASSSSSPERGLPAEKASPPMAKESLSVRSRSVTRSFLARFGTSRTPLRSPVRNVKVVPCVSSGSTPERYVLVQNVDRPSPPTAENSPSKLPQAQQTVSNLHTSNVDGHKEKDRPPSPVSSFNCTEIAAMVANNSFDPDEVASKAYPALVTVSGYRVKEETAPLLRSIISKYGDIGGECNFQSMEIRSSLMEKVCGIYQHMEKTEAILFTPVELKCVLDVVEDLESARVNVKWLHQRLDEINETFRLSKGYSALKETLASNLLAVERKKKDLKALQDELDAMAVKHEKMNELLWDTRAKIKIFYRGGSLVNGLL